jgi:acyl-CoA thioester hydrolase
MIDINYIAKRAVEASAARASSQFTKAPNGAELHITFRGIVYPWHLDHMNHMNVRYYTASFDQASWVLLALLGLDTAYFERHGRGMAAIEQTTQYKRELRCGETFEIHSSIVELREKTMRMRHDLHKTRDGELAASTTILGVHIDAAARRGIPFPEGIQERAYFLNASMLPSGSDDAWKQPCEHR